VFDWIDRERVPLWQLVKERRAMREELGIERFTCDECPIAATCTLAFDPYNQDGDCLADK
jgi:hypothetical protein